MAFGRNKDEVFQRISAVTENVEKPQKKRKKTKEPDAEAVSAPDTSMWKSSSDNQSSVQHFEPSSSNAISAENSDIPTDTHSEKIREVGTRKADARPEIGYTMTARDEDVTGGLYSDSGRTVTMAMRLISYLMFFCGPLYFVGKIFSIIGVEADEITMGLAVSSVIDGIIGCIVFIGAGFIVIALIKILQNLMALQKKKSK